MSNQKKSPAPATLPIGALMLTGGLSSCWAEFCTIPFDTAKVRLQIQGEGNLKDVKYKGVLSAMQIISKEEGPLALWSGLTAGFQRQIVFGSIRLGLYEPIRNWIAGEGKESNLLQKIGTGLITGTIGMLVANPTDLVKVRMQAQGKWKLIDPTKIKYKGVIDAYSQIISQEGFFALWTGVGPAVARNAIINATELSMYDQAKQTVLRNKWLEDGLLCHFACSAFAGFMATVIGSPVDVVKTRIMNADASKGQSYSGVLDCIVKTFRNEGFFAFYKGFNANAQRIITWNIIMFVTWQKLKALYTKQFYS